jgi:nucleoside phosphorylase
VIGRGRLGTARVGVLTIVEREFEAARAALSAEIEVTATGYYVDADPCDVVVMRSADRGNTPATNATRGLLEDFRPEVVILVGIAGGIARRDDIRPGDVVVADYLHYSEFRKIVGGTDRRRYAAYDQPSVSLRQHHIEPASRAGNWMDRLQQLGVEPPTGYVPRVLVGSVVAGEKVLGDLDHEAHKYVVEEYDDALAVDMESFGFGRAVHEARQSVGYNPRLAVIRGISDLVATSSDEVEDNQAQRNAWRPFAATAAAAFAAAVIERIGAVQDPRPERLEP